MIRLTPPSWAVPTVALVYAGTAYKAGALGDPNALTGAYRKAIQARARTLLAQAPQQQAVTP